MERGGSTAEYPVTAPAVGARAGHQVLVPVLVRAVLFLAWVVILANSFTQAREVPLGQLYHDLDAGRVATIEIERPAPDAGAQGTFAVRWDAGLIDSFGWYEYRPGVDEGAQLLEQAQDAGVLVRVLPVASGPAEEMLTQDGWLGSTFGVWVHVLGLMVVAGGWILLITGPQPWFATKWAWFWLLAAVPVLWLAFLAVEPRPPRTSWRLATAGRPVPGGAVRLLLGSREQRLTGGWALVIAWIASALLASTGLPLLSGWL